MGRLAPVRALLDTSVVIGPGSGALTGELTISVVTLAELHYGVLVATAAEVRAERLRRLAILRKLFTALPVDESVAHSDGVLTAAVVHAGRRARGRTMDLLIAATAPAHHLCLYTRNPAALVGVERLLEVRSV